MKLSVKRKILLGKEEEIERKNNLLFCITTCQAKYKYTKNELKKSKKLS